MSLQTSVDPCVKTGKQTFPITESDCENQWNEGRAGALLPVYT